MIYLTKVERKNSKELVYNIFETHTESIITADEELVIKLINTHGIEAKNIYIENNKVKVKEWPHSIIPYSENREDRTSDYILLSKINENRFKLFNCVTGVIYAFENYLKELIKFDRVANCTNDEKIYKSIDTYSIKTDLAFAESINNKYTEFRGKTLLLGMDISFNYIIENDEVKITKYTGNSHKIILPNFITTICDSAFEYRGIQELTLNTELRYIGSNAFKGNRLKFIELPDKVRLVGQNAFDFNSESNQREYKKTNTNTIIID